MSRMNVAVIGVGAMGAPMAQRLVSAGYAVTVCDRDPHALAPFAGRARVVEDASQCAAADILLIVVALPEHVLEVLLGKDGVAAGLHPTRAPVIVVMSTIAPQTVCALALDPALAGVHVLDAPVSGGIDGAQAGSLSIMVGGDATAVARVQPVLDVLASRVFHCGTLGTGLSTKILNNLIGVATWLLMGEIAAVAPRLGMDVDLLVQVMEASSGRSLASGNWPSRKALYARYAAQPSLIASNHALCRKDLGLMLELAAGAGMTLPIARGLQEVVDRTHPAEIARAWQAALQDDSR